MDRALWLGALSVGTITGLIGGIWAYNDPTLTNLSITAFFYCFIFGIGQALVVASVLDAAVATICLMYARDPAGLSLQHQHQYELLEQAWRPYSSEPTFEEGVGLASDAIEQGGELGSRMSQQEDLAVTAGGAAGVGGLGVGGRSWAVGLSGLESLSSFFFETENIRALRGARFFCLPLFPHT